VKRAFRPLLVSGMLTFPASTHVSARFHLKPGTIVTISRLDESPVSRIVFTPFSSGCAAVVETRWPELSIHRPSSSPTIDTVPVAASDTAAP
jgi:hypothetical protein